MVIDNGNPEVKANIFRRILFLWVEKIFKVGYKRTITEDDVFPIDPRLKSERLTALLEQQWFKEAERTKKPSLLLTLLKRHLYTLIWVFFASNIEAVMRCATPLFIARISSYFGPASTIDLETALWWSIGLTLLQLSMVLYRNPMFHHVMRFGTSIRVAVTGLIYRKACRITQKEIGERSVGLIVNLITNDAQRLDEYIVPAYVLFNVWTVLLMSFLLMYYELGLYTALAGIVSTLMFIPLQFLIGKFILYLRGKIAPLTDSRVKTIHEMVLFMKIIKMYGWELMFKNLVEKIRLKEMRFIGLFVLMRALNNTLLYVAPVLSLMICVTVKKYINEPITTAEILFLLSLFGIVRVYINVFLGHSFTFVPQVIHSLRRIQDFLNADEIKHLQKKAAILNLSNDIIVNKNFLHKEKKENGVVEKMDNTTECYEEAIDIRDMSARWGKDTFSLSGLNLNVKKGELIAVVGPVACGKTTLLMSLIQELDIEGHMNIHGDIAFSSQVPWIYNGSIEDNIIFNRPYDKERLDQCIESCYLKRDLELFSNGIYTIVGERGVQLSGGQRARVNLARAVYGENPIVLLDDPLSAVDSRCAKHIFNKLIKEQLSGRTRILVTHATHFLSEVDRIVVMNTEVVSEGNEAGVTGRITDVGTYSELTEKGLNLSMFGAREKKSKRARTLSKISKLSTDSGVEEEDEEKSDSDEESIAAEKPEEVKEEKKSGTLDKRVYLRYLSLGLGYIALPILLISLVAPLVVDMYQQQYVINWREPKDKVDRHEYKYGDGLNSTAEELEHYEKTHYEIYLGLGFIAVFLYFAKAFFFIFLVNRAGRRLHNNALFSILRSPMRYFDTHPIGIIINRFSKDTYFMDERFPDVLLEFVGLFILYTATIALIIYANYWFILALIPIGLLMALTIRYYLGTSIEIRRIEAIKRSPILSHISATLSGLTTIRANNQIDVYESLHYEARDEHTKCWMLFVGGSRWFAQRLDLVTTINGIAAVFMTVLLRDVVGAEIAGLALVYVMNMIGGFQWCTRQYTEAENMATSVERIMSFSELSPEASLDAPKKTKYSMDSEIISNKSAISNSGVIEFRDVRLKYDPAGDYILHGLSFVTKPAEKIGIVGRTGAGKSTILQALFRMVEPEGEILLDGMLTSEMGLHQLRKSISIIPQESLLFSETLRMNLDPFSEFTSEQLWDVLEKVELKKYVAAQAEGLEMMIQEGGGNLSAGQRQLLCLARALLRDNKFLVIDEATANVDEKTDQLIQSTLRKKFSDCTVLTIAHRINTIIDSDRVMVMDSGNVVEFDHPAVLLQNPESIFYDLVKETGMFDLLVKQAKACLNGEKSEDDSGNIDHHPGPDTRTVRLDSEAFSDVPLSNI